MKRELTDSLLYYALIDLLNTQSDEVRSKILDREFNTLATVSGMDPKLASYVLACWYIDNGLGRKAIETFMAKSTQKVELKFNSINLKVNNKISNYIYNPSLTRFLAFHSRYPQTFFMSDKNNNIAVYMTLFFHFDTCSKIFRNFRKKNRSDVKICRK